MRLTYLFLVAGIALLVAGERVSAEVSEESDFQDDVAGHINVTTNDRLLRVQETIDAEDEERKGGGGRGGRGPRSSGRSSVRRGTSLRVYTTPSSGRTTTRTTKTSGAKAKFDSWFKAKRTPQDVIKELKLKHGQKGSANWKLAQGYSSYWRSRRSSIYTMPIAAEHMDHSRDDKKD